MRLALVWIKSSLGIIVIMYKNENIRGMMVM